MKLTARVAWASSAPDGSHPRRSVAAPAQLRTRLGRSSDAAATGHGGQSAPAADDTPGYQITCITDEFALPFWRGEWRRLLGASSSPEKIYQTPEYFRFLVDSQVRNSDRCELYVIKDIAQDSVVGMVPVRLSAMPVAFRACRLRAWTFRPRIVSILGSIPLMPDDPSLRHHLFVHLLQSFPNCAGIAMEAYPVEHQAQLGAVPGHVPYLLHGWRDCHTIPLPADFPAYLAGLSAAMRDDLSRQHRLLEHATGPLTLTRIDRSMQVKELADGIAALAPDGAAHVTQAREYRVLAANRLLLSYVLRSGDDIVAVIAGTRYGDTWHVHEILSAPRHRHLAAGAAALHAALEDVITHFAFTHADFGYRAPGAGFASTYALMRRAHVLMARTHGWHRLLFAACVQFERFKTAAVQPPAGQTAG